MNLNDSFSVSSFFLLVILCSPHVIISAFAPSFDILPRYTTFRSQLLNLDVSSEPSVSQNVVVNKVGTKSGNRKKSSSSISKVKMNGNRKKRSYKSKQPTKSKDDDVREPLFPLKDLKLGSQVEGYVAAFTDFGVFVKIGYDLKGKGAGGYALLHKSQIRDEPVHDLKKLFRIGASVKGLRVITIDHEKGEVGLSLRKPRGKRKAISEFKVGQEYQGKVNRIVPYGAFVDLGAKNNALLHISRISSKKIQNVRHFVNEGDVVTVRIINKDKVNDKMAVSMLPWDADKYLDRRSKQLQKMREHKHIDVDSNEGLKSEVEYFESAIKELEDSLE